MNACREAPWRISHARNPDFWESMLFFVGVLTSKRLFPRWDLSAWVASEPHIVTEARFGVWGSKW